MNYEKALRVLEIRSLELDMGLVKRKYRIMALLYHPDKNPAADARERFQEVHAAYEFLMDYLRGELDYSDGDSEEDEEGMGENLSAYKDILMQFLRSISEQNETSIFYSVVHKITEKCEEKSLELLGKLNKDLLVKAYDILYKYSALFRISEEFLYKVQLVVEDRMKHDECIILNPTLEDLFAKNVYKLAVGSRTLLIPLWHHELVYEIDGADLYVKCIPILPDNYTIDSENNLIIALEYNIADLLGMDDIKVLVGDRQFVVSTEEFRVVPEQQLVLSCAGIPRIMAGDIYNVNRLGNIILDIHLVS